MGTIYKGLVADFHDGGRRMFCLDEEPGSSYSYDNTQTYLLPASIGFFGIPLGLCETDEDRISEGDYSKATKVASVFGWMILCRDMIYNEYQPLEVCDDENGDLEYTISALQDVGGPLNDASGDSTQNVFYIHEIKMDEHNDEMEARIINELPYLLRDFLHVEPEILAYYPSPMESDWEPENAERDFTLRTYAMNQVARHLDAGGLNTNVADNHDKKVVQFTGDYHFSEDEIKMVMGRRNSGSGYPENLKNRDEWDIFERAGFEEAGDSRLLYKLSWRSE